MQSDLVSQENRKTIFEQNIAITCLERSFLENTYAVLTGSEVVVLL